MLVLVSSLGCFLFLMPPHPTLQRLHPGLQQGSPVSLTMILNLRPCCGRLHPLSGRLGLRSVPSFLFPLPVCLNDPVSSAHVILPHLIWIQYLLSACYMPGFCHTLRWGGGMGFETEAELGMG